MATLATAFLTAVCAGGSVVCAGLSYWLARTIHREAKSDQKIIFGCLDHPYSSIENAEHRQSVIGCAVFNKAHRRAYINDVRAFVDEKPVEISWSSSINQLGNTEFPHSTFGIVDSESLYVRRTDGERIFRMRLEVTYFFDEKPRTCTIEFDPFKAWDNNK